MSDTIYQYVETTGVIVPDISAIVPEVNEEWQDVFGDGLNTDSDTPQGVLIAAEVLARQNVTQTNAEVANQINPNESEGVFLDAICALTGLEREANLPTIVSGVLLTGQPLAPIPAGALASTEAQDEFALVAAVQLNAAGQAIGTFQSVQAGPIPCGAGGAGLVNVVSAVLGWETVSNAVAGTLGALSQNDESLRALRRNTLALQAVSIAEAITSAISALPGVIGRQFIENYTDEAETIGGVYLKPHSIWICVDGGTQAQIASALLNRKGVGANWNGAQIVPVVEPASGQTYNVAYDVPTLIPLLVSVVVRQGSFVGDPTADVIAAILAFAANTVPGLQGFSVGEDASPFDLASAIIQLCAGIYVKSVQLSLASTPALAPVEVPMLLFQKATVSEGNISVTVTT